MRKGKAKKRPILPDPRYKSVLIARFAKNLMWAGKLSLAYKILYTALDKAVAMAKEGDGLSILEKAMEHTMPVIETKRRRVGGATWQVPVEVRPDRRIFVGIKSLIRCARKRKENNMIDRLAREIFAASQNEGAAVKYKQDMHKMADANKAFAVYRY